MSISYYKLNLSDISENIKTIYKIHYPEVRGNNRIKNLMHFYLLQEGYMYLIIIFIYLTIFFKQLTYQGSNVYDLILEQSEKKPKIFISSSDGPFDSTKKADVYTELPDKNKFVQIGDHTFFEMRWFSRYLLHPKKDYTEVNVFILTDDSISIVSHKWNSNVKTFNNSISVRKGYRFIGYENHVANAFVFKRSMVKSIVPIIGCFRIYKEGIGFEDDQSTDITTIQTVSKDVLANTKEYRTYMYNRELFNYNPRYVKQSKYNRRWRRNENIEACEVCGKNFNFFESEYNRRWRRNENIEACEVCGVNFTFFKRRHHCRYCGRIICSDCHSLFPLKSWIDKNGTIHNNTTDPGDLKERIFCDLCSKTKNEQNTRHHCRYCGRIICSNCYTLFPLKSWFEKNGTIHNNTTDPGDLKQRIFCDFCSKTKKEEIDKQKAIIAQQDAEKKKREAFWQTVKVAQVAAGGKKKNKYIKKKENVKKVDVYRSKGGYYYKEYKSGKKVRISQLEYNSIKKLNNKVNKLKKQIKDDNLFYPEGLKYAEKYIKKYNKKDFSIGEIATFLYEDKTFF